MSQHFWLADGNRESELFFIQSLGQSEVVFVRTCILPQRRDCHGPENIQILPVDLCFWAFHTVCWESFGNMFSFQWFDWFLFVWRRCCSAHSGTSVLLPIDSWHFGRSKGCQTTQWIKGFKVCALSRLHEFVVVVAACLVVVICWSVSDMLDANLDPDSVRYFIRDSYCKLHDFQVANFAFTIQNWVPMIWNERGNLRKNVPILNSTNLEDTKVCFSWYLPFKL